MSEIANDRNPLEFISTVTEFNDLHDFMQDEQLDRAMMAIINIIAKPDIPAAKAHILIVELQDRKSTRLNSSHVKRSRMPSSA